MPNTKKQKEGDALQLNHRLVLASWFAWKLGYDSPTKMLADVKAMEWDDVGEDSPCPITARPCRISQAELREMDDAIRGDLAKINRRRSPPVRLKYFQYLAALSAEYFLRRRKESPDVLASDINAFAGEYNYRYNPPRFPLCESRQLSKLAFWMATGSGKTLLMHLNYLQCLRHLPFAPNNVLLITPNADMTEQHLAELRASDIPCHRHGESGGGFLSGGDNPVCVLDIHKIQENPGKKSGTVKPEFFEGPNLVFVDEGHKGGGGADDTGYFNKRDKLAKDGFAMEYSATFGQAFVNLQPRKREERTAEYGRAVAFDYSYRYFYADGYGKDFFILNTTGGAEQSEDEVLLGNILSFCQQRLAYDNHPQTMQQHNIAAPLLLMLGTTVTAANTAANKNAQTDIVRIVNFLHRAASDSEWLTTTTEKIINGEVCDDKGRDIFRDKFDFLRDCFRDDIGALCAAVRQKVFHSAAPGNLRVSLLTKTGGGDRDKYQIALRINDNKPFALVYVGAARKLCEIIKEKTKAEVNEDFLQHSLFASINSEESPVNILIGAKKFMEGWSSWRVCGIGLLNVGTTEGPLIIQLFGRGVRLRGEGFSLKRSAATGREAGNAGDCLRLLEMLNIFTVRASFLDNFRNYLHREGAIHKIICVPVQRKQPFPSDLPIIKLRKEDEFDKWSMLGNCDDAPQAPIDLSSAVAIRQSDNEDGNLQAAAMETQTWNFDDEVCRRINFGTLHTRLLEEQNNGGIGNIIITRAQLPKVLHQCKVKTDNNDPLGQFKHDRLQQVAFAALRQAASAQHARILRQWQKQHIKADKLGNKHKNIIPQYRLHLPSDQTELINRIREIIADQQRLAENNASNSNLPRLYYDSHLYNPLLLHHTFKIEPPGLVKSERELIDALRGYVRRNPPADAEICLLRNLPTVGIGFPLDNGKMFYPDFILWLMRGDKKRVVFVEPHGMLISVAHKHNYKAHLGKFLRDFPSLPFELDACIVSATKFDDLQQHYDNGDWTPEDFAKNDIVFMEDLKKQAEGQQADYDAFAKLLNSPAN